jgi:hypothetical protein
LGRLTSELEEIQNRRNDECNELGYESDGCQQLESELSIKQEEVRDIQAKTQISVEKIREQ